LEKIILEMVEKFRGGKGRLKIRASLIFKIIKNKKKMNLLHDFTT